MYNLCSNRLCSNQLQCVPDITVYVNCNTHFAINVKHFNLTDEETLVFAIKNYDYIGAPTIFTSEIVKDDENAKGECVIKIPPEVSRKIIPGAFYTFVLVSTDTESGESIYTKLTKNGNINLDYGAPDLAQGVD